MYLKELASHGSCKRSLLWVARHLSPTVELGGHRCPRGPGGGLQPCLHSRSRPSSSWCREGPVFPGPLDHHTSAWAARPMCGPYFSRAGGRLAHITQPAAGPLSHVPITLLETGTVGLKLSWTPDQRRPKSVLCPRLFLGGDGGGSRRWAPDHDLSGQESLVRPSGHPAPVCLWGKGDNQGTGLC